MAGDGSWIMICSDDTIVDDELFDQWENQSERKQKGIEKSRNIIIKDELSKN